MRAFSSAELCFVAVLFLELAACHGPGRYGHSPQYAPLPEEERAAAGARDFDPVMYRRFPDEWRHKNVSLVGVVTGRSSGGGGAARLSLSLRRLERRNLCENANDEDSCRVTVTERDFGVVHALVALRPEDDVGSTAVGNGSLLRVIGRPGDDADSTDGAPIIRATYYRHWPRFAYVTNGAAREMRQ